MPTAKYFNVHEMLQSSVLYVYGERESIQLAPPYQRISDIWSEDKRQLLIDSLINGFDIPKIYFHEFIKPKRIRGRTYRYAIVDGKQRLESIWGFIDGKFTLATTFDYLQDPSVKAAGMSYLDLALKYPRIKSRFDATGLPVMLVQTDDLDLIEEMFSRLNEAVPLNAAEKRNALGGPLPAQIRAVSKHPFFGRKLAFSNGRYRHYDLAAKFLYVEHNDRFADTKKVYLDNFVKLYKNKSLKEALSLTAQVNSILDTMVGIFNDKDPLLSSVGMCVLYYLITREAGSSHRLARVSRPALIQFEKNRQANREIAAHDIVDASYNLLEFDRLAQSLNDEAAVTFRLRVLGEYLVVNTPRTKTRAKRPA